MAAPINTYELTYIVNAVLSDQQIKEVVARVTRNIQENGGEIIEVDEWGTRRLAYPIRKKRNGYHVNVYFRAPGEAIARLERLLEIEDQKSTRLNSSHVKISYAVFCLKKKKKRVQTQRMHDRQNRE